MAEENQEQNELKELLERGEVETMKKDIGEIREKESEQEREKIASLATTEEAEREKAKREQEIKETEERKIAEEKVQKEREEEIKRLEEKERQILEKPAEGEEKEKELLDFVGEKTKEAWEQEEEERKRFLQKLSGETPEKPATEIQPELAAPPIPQPPERPSVLRKLLIRGIAIVVILFLAGFTYWYIGIRKPSAPSPVPKPIQATTPAKQEILIPPALFAVNGSQTLEIANSQELPSALSQFMATPTAEGYTRIIIKNTQTNQILGLKEFFDAFSVKTPDGLLDKLNDDFTLFVYSAQGVNRLGFVTKIKTKDGLSDALTSWEKTMENDTEGLFAVLGKNKPALATNFKSTNYNGNSFRFLTVSREDFGICYTAAIDDYFIFGTSFAGMKKTMDAVQAQRVSDAGQLFIIGFDGKTVTPQLEKIFEKYRPGGVLLLAKNIENEEQLKKLTGDLQSLSLRVTGLPLFIAVDQEGGLISRVGFAKEKTPQSQITSAHEAYAISKRRGEELKALGINLDLAPVLDVVAKGDFIYGRAFDTNPAESGNLAKSLILGQRNTGVLTAIKHFPGYGGIVLNPEEKLVKTDKAPEISQFKEAMGADPEFVMTSNVVYKEIDPSLPFTFSPKAIQFMKSNLGPDTLIISDDLAQNSLLKNFSLTDVITKPIQAGVNVVIFSGWKTDVSTALDAFSSAVKNGDVSGANISDSVSKIIKLKQKL